MKRILLCLSMSALLCSCSAPKDPAIANAEQFAIEQYGLNLDNIQSVEGAVQDSLLGTVHLSFATFEILKKYTEYLNDEIPAAEYSVFRDSISQVATDADANWCFNGLNNADLKSQDKYSDCWRKVIAVTITYKSGKTDNRRILMDNDGITPSGTEESVLKDIHELQRTIISQRIY